MTGKPRVGRQPAAGTSRVIDLGSTGRDRDQASSPGAAQAAGVAPQRRRVWIPALVAVVVAGIATWSVVPPGPATPALVGSVDATDVENAVVSGQVLYLYRGGRTKRGDVYRLGARVDRIAARPGMGLFAVSGDVVLVVESCADGRQVVTGIDTRTGEPRWQRAGQPVATYHGWLVLNAAAGAACTEFAAGDGFVSPDAPPPAPPGPAGDIAQPVPVSPLPVTAAPPDSGAIPAGPDTTPPTAAQAAVVEVETGRALWTLPLAPGVTPALDGSRPGGPMLVAIDATGHWVRRDLATGAVVPPGGVAAPPPTPQAGSALSGDPDATVLLATPTAVIAVTVGDGGVAVAAFDLATFTLLWTVHPTRNLRGAGVCGDLVCLGDEARTTAVKPDTGAPVWRTPWQVMRQVGTHWAIGVPAGAQPPVAGRTRLLDLAAGGRPVADLTGWSLADSEVYGFGAGEPGGPFTVYRSGQGRTWFARVNPDRGILAPAVLASVAGAYSSCFPGTRYVACSTGATVLVWRLPP